jgi:hypothetical protein
MRGGTLLGVRKPLKLLRTKPLVDFGVAIFPGGVTIVVEWVGSRRCYPELSAAAGTLSATRRHIECAG